MFQLVVGRPSLAPSAAASGFCSFLAPGASVWERRGARNFGITIKTRKFGRVYLDITVRVCGWSALRALNPSICAIQLDQSTKCGSRN